MSLVKGKKMVFFAFKYLLLFKGTSSGWSNVTIDGKRVTTTGNELTISHLATGDEGVYQVLLRSIYLLWETLKIVNNKSIPCQCQGSNIVIEDAKKKQYYFTPADFQVALRGLPYFRNDLSGNINVPVRREQRAKSEEQKQKAKILQIFMKLLHTNKGVYGSIRRTGGKGQWCGLDRFFGKNFNDVMDGPTDERVYATKNT